MTCSVYDIAAFYTQKGVTPLQLQKLLYYAQVWHFVKCKRVLFSDSIKAWIYGPVVEDVWHTFKYMRRSAQIPTSRLQDRTVPPSVVDHLQEVWDAYGHLSGSQLIDLTHQELPWKQSRVGLLDMQPSNNPIVIDEDTTQNFHLVDGKIPHVQRNPFARGSYSNQLG